MGKLYELSFIQDLRDEVSDSMKAAFIVDGVKKVANYLDIDSGYAREIGYRNDAPFGNLERCMKAIKMTSKEYYYAVVIPYGITTRYNIPVDGLKVFSCSAVDEDKAPLRRFETEVFRVDNNLYKQCLRYWRYSIDNGITSISTMCEITGLSDRTIFNALHLNLRPRCSTMQKLLYVYGNRLAIIKTPCKLKEKRITIAYYR